MRIEMDQLSIGVPLQRLRSVLVCLTFFLAQAIFANTKLQASLDALNHPSQEVRAEAATALFNLGMAAKASLPDLIAALRKEIDTQVRLRIVWAIRVVGRAQPTAVPPLAEVLTKDDNAAVRAAAAESIGVLGLAPEISVSALVQAMADPDLDVRKEAIIALGSRAFVGMASKSVPALRAALSDAEYVVWSTASDALGSIGPDAVAAAPTLQKMTADENWVKRRSATETLGEIGTKASFSELKRMLIDPVPEVRIQAAIALLRIEEDESAAMQQILNTLNLPMGPEAGPGTEGLNNAHMVQQAAWAVGEFSKYAPSHTAKSLALLSVYPKNINLNITSRAALLKLLDHFVVHPEELSRDDLLQAKATLMDRGKQGLSPELAKIDAVLEISKALEARKIKTHTVFGVGIAVILALGIAGLRKIRRKPNAIGPTRANLKPRIFLCYNRIDSSALCGRVYDRLSALWGKENVFRDVDSSNPGDYFPQRMQECIRDCDVVIVIMGRRWTDEQLSETIKIFHEPDCHVRDEIEIALTEKKFLVPVMHDGARMPSPRVLPSKISQLAKLTALQLSERHFDIEISGLVDLILNHHSKSNTAPP